ncbi:Kallikrein-11 [Fukomys damarensis]|uniref:Kallikrein-11 n=1 Tax=Fukomys damarensis TaxID=885580 RepID=A0A091D547_FUKDA|nr:Kallikrein-11 [Fukomys damarensis]
MGLGTFLLLCVLGLSQADKEKIFDGAECVPNSQPWQVGLFEGRSLRCGGVLIHPRWVLTAAHCNGRYWVRLGEHSLSRLDWTEQIRRGGLSVTHPGYRGALQSHEHDLRLLRLRTPIRLTRSVQPLPLPSACAAAGTNCHISGWGTTNQPWDPFPDRLQCLNLTIVSTDACRAVFPGRITANMVCAGGVAGKDACQVALFQKTRLLCGATLIAPQWLLTAAHCRKPNYRVLLGEHNLHREDGYEQRQTATESFPHPGFNNSLPNKDHRNDIMLVKLPRAADITQAVRPLSLPSHCVTAGTNCLISGWGTTSSPQLRLPNTLRCANISIIRHGECERAYPGNITDTMVCASVRKEGKDSCQGDSGGPLVCNGSLQGIISWGQDPCAVSRKPGVYTKVCKYVDWIQKIMHNN